MMIATISTFMFIISSCKKDQCSPGTTGNSTDSQNQNTEQQCQTQETTSTNPTQDSNNNAAENDGTNNADNSTTQPPPTRTPASDGASFDLYQDIAIPTGQSVDNQYPQSRELMVVRGSNQNFAVDKCDPEVQGQDRFADRITYAVNKRFVDLKIDIGSSVAPIFGLSKDRNTYVANSLISHPFCRVTESTLQNTFQGKRIPSAATIKKAQKFTDILNRYRNQALSGNPDGRKNAVRIWSKFMMCLGYMESLTSADSRESDQIAAKYNFRRPAGVNLHNDSNQTNADSVLGIGIFQVSNVVKDGDTYSCVKDWNAQFPACALNINSTRAQMVPILGSAHQTFNAYCGAAFITRMFGVQINALKSKNTHPDNVKKDGSLKSPEERCVTPFANVNVAYNHFAPLQNGSGFTLDTILTCTLKDEQ